MPYICKKFTPAQLAATARLFSSAVLQELARKGESPLLSRLVKESNLADFLIESSPLADIFDLAFSILKKKAYRHEYVYKAAIAHKLLLGKHSIRTASMLSEFRVGNCKADVAILNGTSTVYEIKSERDNLDRLQSQVSAYRTVFAKVNIITGSNHVASIFNIVPEDVGILVLNDRYKISTVREAEDNPSRVDPAAIFNSLSTNESIKALKLLGFEIPDLPNTKLHKALGDLFKTIDPASAHNAMVKVLKNTRSLLPLSELLESLPSSLRAAALSTPLRQKDHARLLEAVEKPLKDALRWAW